MLVKSQSKKLKVSFQENIDLIIACFYSGRFFDKLAKKENIVGGVNYLIKYRACLQEIKEIAEKIMREYDKVKDNPLALYHTEINGASSVAKQILQKIAEVENG